MKFMLDTNIFDAIIAEPGMVDRLNKLSEAGKVILLTTHIQEDELAAIPDPPKRAEIAKIVRRCTTTDGAVFGVSRYGMATFGGQGESGCSINDVRTVSGGHTNDALIATSASRDADVLVTNEDRLPKRLTATSAKCKVWDFAQFKAHINSLS